MICPACRAPNPDGSKFCGECGAPLGLACPSCGAPYTGEQRFCNECGTSLTAAPARRLGTAETGAVGEPPAPVPDLPASAPAPTVGEMRLVSVLFVDLVGFTSLSEGRDAEDVRELLGRYFDDARTIVGRYGGTIEKFIGDAVMAVWGAPVAREDDAERAVRAALEIVDAVSVFGASAGTSELRARAGVVTGQVAALENPGEGLVVGDRVNTASRVQSVAEPGTVLVDEVTHGVTSASILYEDAGAHTVKGKAEPLRLFRAERVVSGVSGRRRAEGIDPPFVGRDGELRLLKELFHGAQERRSARLVTVTGEAGIGKSRLLREFTNYTDGLADTVLWHSGRCLSYGEGVTYWALAEMVRQRLGIPEDAPSAEASERLDAGLARWVPDLDDRAFLAPRLGALIGVADPGLGREDLFAGWRMFFERLAAHMPVVLVFEDVQWADAGLLEFIAQLLDWSAQSPIFVLALARPELAARHAGWPAGLRAATLIPLEPLADDAMGQLIDGVLADAPRAAVRQIVGRAEGVPLYAVETLRALVDRGALVEHDGRLSLQGELGELDVPASLGSLLAARIDGLDRDERTLIKAMSVFGGSFPRATAVSLAGLGEENTDHALSGLVRRGVLAIRSDPLSPDRGQFTFAQGLFRAVAYEMLSRTERKARHLAAADHLVEAFPREGEEVTEAIATHLLDALRAGPDDPDADELRRRTIAALRRSAQRAVTVGAPETAEQALLRARELLPDDEPDRLELTRAAGEMAMRAGRYEPALALFDEAEASYATAGRIRDAAQTTVHAGLCLRRLGRLEEAITRLEAALASIDANELDPVVGELNHQLGASLAFSGQHDRAQNFVDRAIEVGESLDLIPLVVDAFITKAIVSLYRGGFHSSDAMFRAAARLAEQHGLEDVLPRALGNLTAIAAVWDSSEDLAELDRSLALGRRRGERFMESMAAGNIMSILRMSGRWDEVLAREHELLQAAEDRPGDELVAYSPGLVRAARGEADAAQRSLERISAWRDFDDHDYVALHAALRLTVAVTLSRDEHERALDRLLATLPLAAEATGASADSVRVGWMLAVRSARGLGRRQDAEALIALLSAHPPGHVPPYLRAELNVARGLLAADEGRGEDVEAPLRAGIAKLADLAYPYPLALARIDLAEWLVGQGREAEAAEPLAEAIADLERLGAAPALERARGVMRALESAPSPSVPSG